MTTYALAPVRSPYTRRTSTKYDAAFFRTELGNIERAVQPGSGFASVLLTSNGAITIATDGVLSGDSGWLELVQDGTGGWLPTWTNATSTNGAVPAPAVLANAPTLYAAVYVAPSWVLSVHASNYGNTTVDATVTHAVACLDAAMLPLPRTLALVSGYTVTFDE